MKFYMLAQTGHKISFKEVVKHIKQAGFSGVYLNGNESISLDDGLSLVDSDVQYVIDQGLEVDAYHLPYNVPFILLNSLWQDDINAADAIRILTSHLDFAKRNGIFKTIIHTSSGKNPPEITRRGLDNFKKVIEHGLDLGLQIAVENTRKLDYLAALLQDNPDDNVGFCFDIGHANAYTNNLYSDVWLPFISRLKSIHLHDNDGSGDLHLIPKRGNIDFHRVFNDIIKRTDVNVCVETYYKGREEFYQGVTPKQFFEEALTGAKWVEEQK